MRQINTMGLNLIKSFEGFRAKSYQDIGGVWTIGYGRTVGVDAATPPISEQEAEDFLRDDIAQAEGQVMRLAHVPLTDNQYAALVSLTYNVGTLPLMKTLGDRLHALDYTGAADEFCKWSYAGGKLSSGLIKRRIAERELFLT